MTRMTSFCDRCPTLLRALTERFKSSNSNKSLGPATADLKVMSRDLAELQKVRIILEEKAGIEITMNLLCFFVFS